MKKLVIVFLVILFLFSSALLALAHPGNTDIRGGHRDNDTGRYHYHHGYPAHQHPNGECPYDFEDKTASSGSGSSGIVSSSFDELKQQASLKELKSLSESRLIYIIILCVTLAILFVVLILTVNKKNKEEENRKSADSKIEELEKEVNNSKNEIENLKSELNKQDDLNCELIYKNTELKEQINQIENKQSREIYNAIHKIQTHIAENLGLVSFPMQPSESVSDYFIRILLSEYINPLHFADTKFINKEQEEHSLIYAKFIKFKYENKGYRVTVFNSKYTKEKYLFASNLTTLLLIQCIYTTNELSNIEHVQALNHTLIDLKRINHLENVNAILICNSPISNDVKENLSKYKFNYRENISLNIKKDK